MPGFAVPLVFPLVIVIDHRGLVTTVPLEGKKKKGSAGSQRCEAEVAGKTVNEKPKWWWDRSYQMIISFYITLYCRLDGRYCCLELYQASYVLGPVSRGASRVGCCLVYQVQSDSPRLPRSIWMDGYDVKDWILCPCPCPFRNNTTLCNNKKGILSRLHIQKNQALEKT